MTADPLTPEEERDWRKRDVHSHNAMRLWLTLDAARARIAELGKQRALDSDQALMLLEKFKRERDEARAENDKHFKAWYEAEREIKRVRAECERLTGLITSLRGAQGSMDAAEGK